jgi:hypothetical protein
MNRIQQDQSVVALAGFLARAATHRVHREWLHCEHMTVYVRFNDRYLREGLAGLCLVIANVVVDENQRRKGHLKRFLQTAAEVAQVAIEPPDYLYIEGVMEHGVAEYLRRSGWNETRLLTTASPSFYRLVSEMVEQAHTS